MQRIHPLRLEAARLRNKLDTLLDTAIMQEDEDQADRINRLIWRAQERHARRAVKFPEEKDEA